jgi:hypothetical protein
MQRIIVAATAPTGFDITNPIGASDLAGVIKAVTDAIRNLSIPVAVIMILWAGFNYLTAAGNPVKIAKAGKILLYTGIGLVIIFIGGGFVDLIKSVIGADSGSGEVQTLPIQTRDLNQLPQSQ